jgi:hypothetical protein
VALGPLTRVSNALFVQWPFQNTQYFHCILGKFTSNTYLKHLWSFVLTAFNFYAQDIRGGGPDLPHISALASIDLGLFCKQPLTRWFTGPYDVGVSKYKFSGNYFDVAVILLSLRSDLC